MQRCPCSVVLGDEVGIRGHDLRQLVRVPKPGTTVEGDWLVQRLGRVPPACCQIARHVGPLYSVQTLRDMKNAVTDVTQPNPRVGSGNCKGVDVIGNDPA